MAWGGLGLCKKKNSIRVGWKKIWAPPILDSRHPLPPHAQFSTILSSPALVLGLITLCTPNKTNWPAQVQILKTKLHFLFISKIHPLTHGIPFFTSYSFLFFLSSLIHFHLHQYRCLPTSPKTPVLCTHSPKKIKNKKIK